MSEGKGAANRREGVAKGQVTMEQRDSGYEQNYQRLVPGLRGCDFGECAPRLGLKPVPGGVEAEYLGRAYRVTEEGVAPLDGAYADPNHRSTLIHYALSKGEGQPSDDFLGLFQLPGVLRGRKTPGNEFLSAAMERAFGEKGHALFARAAESLGGEYLGVHPSGGKLWLFRTLPRIHMQVVFTEADEEFPVEVRVLFDSHATEYLGFECLAFMHGALGQALAQAGRRIDGQADEA
ncbi:MAG: DUF3786 domain-containing protein [Deltaproteobacteria bacterium]|jgi:hypothetical protein|nr:DUF3786 domain-containing protein [Deltaproteobacteria bacterium]